MCINTEVGIFSFNKDNKFIIISFVYLGIFSKYSSVLWECRILARSADEKSNENIWISKVLDFSNNFNTH